MFPVSSARNSFLRGVSLLSLWVKAYWFVFPTLRMEGSSRFFCFFFPCSHKKRNTEKHMSKVFLAPITRHGIVWVYRSTTASNHGFREREKTPRCMRYCFLSAVTRRCEYVAMSLFFCTWSYSRSKSMMKKTNDVVILLLMRTVDHFSVSMLLLVDTADKTNVAPLV